jgi:hypothetical protein
MLREERRAKLEQPLPPLCPSNIPSHRTSLKSALTHSEDQVDDFRLASDSIPPIPITGEQVLGTIMFSDGQATTWHMHVPVRKHQIF